MHETGARAPAISWRAELDVEDMIDRHVIDELGERISQAVRDGPGQDLEKNLRVLLAAFFDRFDVVVREDFEVQKKLLERAQAKLGALEARVAELEARRNEPTAR
jgi:ubiquinone biosynthesis accessory factor UbiK